MKNTVSLLAFFAAVIIVASLLVSCSPSPTDLLSYQSYPLEFSGATEAGGTQYSFSATVTGPSDAKLSFSKPESLKGYTFTITPDGITLTYGDISVPYNSKGIPGGSGILMKLFSLSPEEYKSGELIDMNGMKVQKTVWETDLGDIIAYTNSETGYPLRFETSENGTPLIIDITEFTPPDSNQTTPQ